MASPRIVVPDRLSDAALETGLEAIRSELHVPGPFPADVIAAASAHGQLGHPDAARWLTAGGAGRVDRTDLEFVTLDPLGSRDLDQAFCITVDGAGHTLHYAIADVAAHIDPDGPIARESLLRGETIYLPDRRVPLHPPELSEGAASLLPGVDRLAVLWTLTIDADGELVDTRLERATVRSREQLDYAGAEAALAASTAHPQLVALAELGPRLIAAARRRGAIELPEPAQELVGDAATGWTLSWLPRRAVEDWNAQLSLTTGRAAAALMLKGRSGLLRTLPPAPPEAQPRLRLAAAALGVEWPAGEPLAERLASLDSGDASHLALIDQARSLLRGAGYLPLMGQTPDGEEALHAAVAAPYAHVTAPLRRLGDRFATEAVLAAVAGVSPPAWVTAALPAMPEVLTASGRRSGAVTRAILDLAEAIVLEARVGEVFDAAVIEVSKGVADIRIVSPPIRARAEGPELVAGTQAAVTLTEASPVQRRVRFTAEARPVAT